MYSTLFLVEASLNPLMLSGLFYINSLDQFINQCRPASDQGLYFLFTPI